MLGWVSLLVTELAIVMDRPSRTQAAPSPRTSGYGKASSGPGRAAPGWYCGSAVAASRRRLPSGTPLPSSERPCGIGPLCTPGTLARCGALGIPQLASSAAAQPGDDTGGRQRGDAWPACSASACSMPSSAYELGPRLHHLLPRCGIGGGVLGVDRVQRSYQDRRGRQAAEPFVIGGDHVPRRPRRCWCGSASVEGACWYSSQCCALPHVAGRELPVLLRMVDALEEPLGLLLAWTRSG